jgi:hypothetical protein
VEVVLALGVASFCLVALLGLFSNALTTNRNSVAEFDAAHIAQSLLVTRRADPKSVIADFPLPPLSQAGTGSALLDVNGKIVPLKDARFGINYRLLALPQAPLQKTAMTQVHLSLHWPAQSTPETASGHYELITVLPSL